ncbi:non-homologous end-joining DNA ligase [Microbispora sp. RL4-1S]|uniref:DNA ligase (ATP) n=1 Tax=Microbispora oryzae TaxID=2806554 RepID=A0A940WL24_9ACTN|nr:non-homologous end-joining DNA ligase [Microbispora oryzae]MBP2707629.1 non-homologous end-joining DNA ligase [Microbispora oryzae]
MAVPYPVEPMLAVPGELPGDGDAYALEVKWDGIRAIAYAGRDARVTGRHGADFTSRYPEVRDVLAPLAGRGAVLDGEVVAFDPLGRPSFARLQRRMHVTDPAGARLLGHVPVTYVPFDLLHLDGHSLYDLPYRERRDLLGSLGLDVPPYFPCEPEVVEATRRQGLEGVVAKRLDSPYRPGRRVGWWVKVKNLRTADVVIGGWKPGRGRRAGGVGSLLLGVYGERPYGGFEFVGHVGTGFTDAMLDDTYRLLAPLRIGRSAFSSDLPGGIAKDAVWVRPEVVGEVAYTMWTRDGRLRNPVWRGVRADRVPAEVRREEPR